MASVMRRARRCCAGTVASRFSPRLAPGIAPARGGPGLEKRLLAGDDEPTFTGLQVDGASLQPGGGQEDSLGVNGRARAASRWRLIAEQQDHEDPERPEARGARSPDRHRGW